MSYWDIAVMSRDEDLTARIQACSAQEQHEVNPWAWVMENILTLVSQPDWPEAWASAIAAGVEQPGRDAGVITDGMILSAVQATIAEQGEQGGGAA